MRNFDYLFKSAFFPFIFASLITVCYAYFGFVGLDYWFPSGRFAETVSVKDTILGCFVGLVCIGFLISILYIWGLWFDIVVEVFDKIVLPLSMRKGNIKAICLSIIFLGVITFGIFHQKVSQEQVGCFELQVGKLCEYITSKKNVTDEQRTALITNINVLLDTKLDPPLTNETLATTRHLLAKSIETKYRDVPDKLDVFLDTLKSRMGDNYPLKPYNYVKEYEALADPTFVAAINADVNNNGQVTKVQQLLHAACDMPLEHNFYSGVSDGVYGNTYRNSMIKNPLTYLGIIRNRYAAKQPYTGGFTLYQPITPWNSSIVAAVKAGKLPSLATPAFDSDMAKALMLEVIYRDLQLNKITSDEAYKASYNIENKWRSDKTPLILSIEEEEIKKENGDQKSN